MMYINSWAELTKASLDLVQTSFRTVEMLTASRTVIASRMGSMAGAARNPWGGDHVELARMVPEKVSAFSDAAHSLSKHWSAVFVLASEHVSQANSIIFGGRFQSPAELCQMSSKATALATNMIASTLESGSVALAPIHRQATSNAKRLSPGN
jgi:hypothetical protein